MATPGKGPTAGEAKSKTDVKLIILGTANIGKTCLLQRYVTGNFAETISSIGASLALKKWGEWNVALWDTAGEEKYASLSSFYCRGASVAILAFDLTDARSLQKLQEVFIPLVEDSADSCLTMVVGTKLDLVSTKGRQVKTSEGRELAERQHSRQLDRALRVNPHSYLKSLQGKTLYIETSAKTGEGVTELFDRIQEIILPQLEIATGGGPRAQKVTKRAKPQESSIKLDAFRATQESRPNTCCAGGGNN